MIRVVFSLFFWVIVARWSYEEIKIYSPSSIPKIDQFLDTITPTTHDQWPTIELEEIENELKLVIKEAEIKASDKAEKQEMSFRNFLSQLR